MASFAPVYFFVVGELKLTILSAGVCDHIRCQLFTNSRLFFRLRTWEILLSLFVVRQCGLRTQLLNRLWLLLLGTFSIQASLLSHRSSLGADFLFFLIRYIRWRLKTFFTLLLHLGFHPFVEVHQLLKLSLVHRVGRLDSLVMVEQIQAGGSHIMGWYIFDKNRPDQVHRVGPICNRQHFLFKLLLRELFKLLCLRVKIFCSLTRLSSGQALVELIFWLLVGLERVWWASVLHSLFSQLSDSLRLRL